MPRATRSSARTAVAEEVQQLSSPPATPAATKRKAKSAASPAIKKEPSTPANISRKRVRKGDEQTLPTPSADSEIVNDEPEPRPKKRSRRSLKSETKDDVKVEEDDDDSKVEDLDAKASPKKTPKKPKKADYGLTPGESPYPDYERPTAEECKEVIRLLEKVHGKAEAPKSIPPPSLDVSGCGEVPSVLDALVRTRLSANTTNKNSSTAFQGLVKRFGTIDEGIGKGSVDWDAVRQAPNKDVFKAIERGGLANVKSRDIQAILQMVYEENQERKAALESSTKQAAGEENEPEAEKKAEISKAAKNIISLDHLHLLPTQEAIQKMLTYPGIGPKTASCVAMFCMQRPSFAVDTHVFRLCQYLGWVPKTPKKGQPKVDRNTTYSHCDARIPDEYKYALHQLLIRHGKVCPRCRAATGQTSENWEKGCPIEHLVKRHGAKKGGMSAADRKKAKEAAAAENDEVDAGDEVKERHGEIDEESDEEA